MKHPVMAAGLAANLAFYLAFVLHDGPVICVDTPSYINMAYSREPVYPTFLWILRHLFGTEESVYGTDQYLVAAVVIQAVIMAVCVWYTSRVVAGVLPGRGSVRTDQWQIAIRRTGRATSSDAPQDEAYDGEVISYIVANLAFWGVDLLNRFAAARGSMYVECIMTESLCIPLFYLFIAWAYLYFSGHRHQDFIRLFLLMFLMMSIRKQEMITCVILCGFAFLYELLCNRCFKRFVACVLISVIALAAMTLLDYSYNYVRRGVWMHHTHNYKGAACTFLYTASPEDAELFDDPLDRKIYEDIYAQMEEQGLTYDSIDESDWIVRTDHYAESYDYIGYDILIPTITRYVDEEQPDLDSPHRQIAIDEHQKVFQNTLIRQDWSRLLELWQGNFIEGFVNTVLRKTRPLARAAAVLYAVYAVAWCILLYKEHKAAGETETGNRPVLLFASLIMTAIVVNVFVVGSMIFTQTRYMIYNMAFFYLALYTMIMALLHACKG